MQGKTVYYQRIGLRPPGREFAGDGSLQGKTVYYQRIGLRPPERLFAGDGSVQGKTVNRSSDSSTSSSCSASLCTTHIHSFYVNCFISDTYVSALYKKNIKFMTPMPSCWTAEPVLFCCLCKHVFVFIWFFLCVIGMLL